MSNYIHLVLRSRPDIVKEWSDKEVARRWLRLFPIRRGKDGSPSEPEDFEISMITKDQTKLSEIRTRLSDVSWWMRCTAENIARRSNKEDQCTGRFREGRHKAQVILDEASLLACAAYVDLNPVRGVIPSHLAPLLNRLGVDVEGWCDVVKNFGKLFKLAATDVKPSSAISNTFANAVRAVMCSKPDLRENIASIRA